MSETKRGGARPGAGRPKGSKNKEPRETGTPTKRLWIRLHPHVLEAIEREAKVFGMTINQTVVHVIDHNWRCSCDECRARRKESNAKRTEGFENGGS